MEPNYVLIEGIKLAYYQHNPEEENILFFIHGNSSSANSWKEHFQDVLFRDYHLIAIDLPGHGYSFYSSNSDKDYNPTGTADFISKVVKGLSGNKNYILIGFSYGSNIVSEMIAMDIKPSGIVLISGCVLGKDYGMDKVFRQNINPSIYTYNETDKNVVEGFIREHISNDNEEEIINTINDYFSVDKNFKTALFKGASEGKISDEIEALKTLNIPVLVIYGENDQLVNSNYLANFPFPIWNKIIYKIPEAGHWVHLESREAVSKIIADYTEDVFRPIHASLRN